MTPPPSNRGELCTEDQIYHPWGGGYPVYRSHRGAGYLPLIWSQTNPITDPSPPQSSTATALPASTANYNPRHAPRQQPTTPGTAHSTGSCPPPAGHGRICRLWVIIYHSSSRELHLPECSPPQACDSQHRPVTLHPLYRLQSAPAGQGWICRLCLIPVIHIILFFLYNNNKNESSASK